MTNAIGIINGNIKHGDNILIKQDLTTVGMF